MIKRMKLYWIAYDHGPSGTEMIDGPYGTYVETLVERDSLLVGEPDEKLIIVSQTIEVLEEK